MGARPVGVVARTPRTPLTRVTSRKRAPPVRRDRGGGTSSQHRLGEKALLHTQGTTTCFAGASRCTCTCSRP